MKDKVDDMIAFIRNYYKSNNLKGIVIGISGGKDSAVSAALFTKALGCENVVGVTMPCHSISKDRGDALLISKHFGFEMINVDLTNPFDTYKKEIDKLGYFTSEELNQSDTNLKPRLRMSTLYYIAALYSNLKGGTYIVCGNGNKCEEFVGYFTKGGDSVADIKPLSNLKVSEVIELGEILGVPHEVLYKTPADGLTPQSDEDKLGVKYSDIEK